MHADFQELLSLRDGAPLAAEVAQHVARCTQCTLELGRLTRLAHELNQLPQLEPPPHVWRDIQADVGKGWMVLSAAAAAACLIIVLTVLWSAHGPLAPDTPLVAGEKDSIGQLVTRSQQLEAVLRTLPQRPAVERAATSATIDELQNRIQMLDLQLSSVMKNDADREQARRLWSTRVALLDSLVYVRYAEAARNGYQSVNTIDTGVI
jgi:hypothetical protein